MPERKLRTRKPPVIEHYETANTLILKTKGPRTARQRTLPHGIVFHDDSYLTVFEEWSRAEGSLLAYKYNYLQGDQSLRYELDKEKREGIPLHHVHSSTLSGVHVPCGSPPADFGEVLEMLVQHFVA